VLAELLEGQRREAVEIPEGSYDAHKLRAVLPERKCPGGP
jgi:hypothetical protein